MGPLFHYQLRCCAKSLRIWSFNCTVKKAARLGEIGEYQRMGAKGINGYDLGRPRNRYFTARRGCISWFRWLLDDRGGGNFSFRQYGSGMPSMKLLLQALEVEKIKMSVIEANVEVPAGVTPVDLHGYPRDCSPLDLRVLEP